MNQLTLQKLFSKKIVFAFFSATILSNNITSQEIEKNQNFEWFNTNKSFKERAKTLVASLTLEEKISLMVDQSAPIDRLNIPEYNWWNECLHGVARNGRATVFPQAIGLAATFDEDLIFRVADAISTEARAKFNASIAIGNRGKYAGLTFWTPNINIFRDPRWGRGQETYGEDPYLTSKIGVNFVKGLQGNHPKYLKSAACAKHYAVHSGPEELRHEFDAIASKKDMAETYLPAFEALVKEAKVEGVMGAYNRVNGEGACASPYLLEKLLKDTWGFKGYIVSDCWALSDLHKFHNVTKTAEESAAAALNVGLNVNCGNVYPALDGSIKQGLTTEKQLDKVLEHQLLTRFKLGFFDPSNNNPYNSITTDVVDSEAHRSIALEAAQKSIVLLKNKNNLLPLKKDLKSVYVAGPNAAREDVLLGNYYGVTSKTQTILDGIVSKVSAGTSINYKQGLLPFQKNVNPIDWSTGEISRANVGIIVMGLSGNYEGEEGEAIASESKGDRIDIRLPQNQIDYIKKIKAKNTGNPLVLILTGGSPIAMPEVYDLVDAIVFAWYPGEEGGQAVADILFGDVVPSGKLPITFPKSVDDLPPYNDYNMAERTYKYMTKAPQFPFGFGLSYTTFKYTNLKISKEKVSFSITNNGKVDAEEVTQVYVSSPNAGKEDPISTLTGFTRVSLKAGVTKKISIPFSKKAFVQFDSEGNKITRKGTYTIHVGGASPNKVTNTLGVDVISGTFKR